MEDILLEVSLQVENEQSFSVFWEKKNELSNEKFKLLESLILDAFSISDEEREKRYARIKVIEEEDLKLEEEYEQMKERINSNKTLNVLGQIMGVERASAVWGLSAPRIKHLCSEGKIKAVKIGKTWIIDKNQSNPRQRKSTQQ